MYYRMEVACVTLVSSKYIHWSPQIPHYKRLTSALTTEVFIPLLALCSTNILKKEDIQQLHRLHNVRFQSTSQGAAAIQHSERGVLEANRVCARERVSVSDHWWGCVRTTLLAGESLQADTHSYSGVLRLARGGHGMQLLHPIESS